MAPALHGSALENWINGLNGDWCVSRQRFFGVPFPVWYRVGEDGTVDHGARLLPREDQLPIDPSTDVPEGYRRSSAIARVGSAATRTSWTPGRRHRSPRRLSDAGKRIRTCSARVFPMDVRPQAHDIIRTWLFSTVLRSELEHRSLPWFNAAISGLGARSRSQEDVEVQGQRGHAHGPARGARVGRRALLGGERPARHRYGVRPRPDEGGPAARDQAAQRVEVRPRPRRARASRPVTHLLDRGLLTSLGRLIEDTTRALEDYDYARALQITETFFWSLCDNYLEMVKSRRYGDHGADAAGSANVRTVVCALGPQPAVRAVLPFRDRGGLVVVAWWCSLRPAVHEVATPIRPPMLTGAAALVGGHRGARRDPGEKSIEQRRAEGAYRDAEVRWPPTRSGCWGVEHDLRAAAGIDRFVYVLVMSVCRCR